MPNLFELPFELVLAVVRFLSNEELRHLSLVCRHLRRDCQAMLLQTCTIPITLTRSVEGYRVLFQTPHFKESIRFMSLRGRVVGGVPMSSTDGQRVLAEVAGHIPTLHRLQYIEIVRMEPSISLLDAIFRAAFNKPISLVLRYNIYPEEYRFPGQELKIHHIEVHVTDNFQDASKNTTIARAFLPRLVSACATTLSSLHIYDDLYQAKMWDIPPVRLKSLTATASRDPSLVAFLQSQTSLEELRITYDDSRVQGWASKLSSSDLPRLRSVTASYGSLRHLIAGRAIREANPDPWYPSSSYDSVHDFLHNTCPSAAGKGVESIDLGFVLNRPTAIFVLAKSRRLHLSNIRNLGIPCHVQDFSLAFAHLRSFSRLASLYLFEDSQNWTDPHLGTKMIRYSSILHDACFSFKKLTVSSSLKEGQMQVDYDSSMGRWIVGINKTGRSMWATRFT